MSRTVELLDDSVAIRLTGWTRMAALSIGMDIPYSTIRSVSARPFRRTVLKIAGADTGLTDYKQGLFRVQGEWAFLSLEDREKTITLELAGLTVRLVGEVDCRLVVVGVEDPEGTADAIAARSGALLITHELVPSSAPAGRGDELTPGP